MSGAAGGDDWAGTDVQYRVVGMRGRPSVTGVYSSAEFGPDALRRALAALAARGGRLQRREVSTGAWLDWAPPPG